jgi:coenzyme F420-0:L-glutamate ligase/coenzyme F420-1:gamma-L-glutamate ligase
MHNSLVVSPVLGIPIVKPGDSLEALLLAALEQNNIQLVDGDILCVASKVVSVTEDRFVKLDAVAVGPEAESLHQRMPRKDPCVLQLILNEATNGKADVRITGNWVGARVKLGRILTSAGIDKVNDKTVLLLPTDPDASAKKIAVAIEETFGVRVGVLITDSDGREGVAGATQLCVGIYGIHPIRKQNNTEETVCDMLAAAAGLVMGQRGNGIPAVVVSGFKFDFTETTKLADAY